MKELELFEAIEPLLNAVSDVQRDLRDIQLVPGPAGVDGQSPAADVVAKSLIDNHLESIKGPAGDTPDQVSVDLDDVRQALIQSDEFIALVKGDKGDKGTDADARDTAKLLVEQYIDVIKSEDGWLEIMPGVADVCEHLKHDHQFIGLINGEGEHSVSAANIAKTLYETYGDTIRGEKGEPGTDGVGIMLEDWAPGIYRKGAIVAHHIGQYFKAGTDTNDEPGYSTQWVRIGSGGFRYCHARVKDAQYVEGDIYTDDGSCYIWNNNKGHMLVQTGRRGKQGQRGEQGVQGVSGKSAPNIVDFQLDKTGLSIVMDDGSIYESSFSGLSKHISEVAKAETMSIIDQLNYDKEKIGIPINIYRGIWQATRHYKTGDAVQFNKALWLARKPGSNRNMTPDQWEKIAGLGGGGGGGGGGAGGWPPLVTSLLNMQGFRIHSVGNPRLGTVGNADAVNKLTMQQEIAASSLFQGVYKPALNTPGIGALTDSGFKPPVAGASIAKPDPGATDPGTGNVIVWFDLTGLGFDSFPATITAPIPISIYLSGGAVEAFNLAAKTYADKAAIQAEFESHTTAAVVSVPNDTTTGFWIGVETLAPLYAFGVNVMVGGGFPDAVAGTANTVLNTYNWIISTADPNVPEYALPGIPGISPGTILRNSDNLQWNGHASVFELLRGGNLTQAFADSRYWQLTAGNMIWLDQSYNKGAVVLHRGAFYQSTQNIIVGTGEPGTTPTSAIWVHINAAFGSVTFFGAGDYDSTDSTAANNWGMPLGTFPNGRQPQDGDIYFDVLSDTTTNFTVVTQPPSYLLTGTVTPGVDTSLGSLVTVPTPGSVDINGFSVVGTPFTPSTYYDLVLTAVTTIVGGYFDGVVLHAGKYIVVWSGDIDADNDGWTISEIVPGSPTPYDWSITTPHPQSVPDVITSTTTWGRLRNYEITIPATTDGQGIGLIKGIPDETGVINITIEDLDPAGAVFKFTVAKSHNTVFLVSPVIVDSHNSHISEFGVVWDAVHHGILKIVTKANAIPTIYHVVVESTTVPIDRIELHNQPTTIGISKGARVSGQLNYPNENLTNTLKALSGDAQATVPDGTKLGDNLKGITMSIPPGTLYKFSGTASNSSENFEPLIRFLQTNGSPFDKTLFSAISSQTDVTGNTVKIISDSTIFDSSATPGFLKMVEAACKINKHLYFVLAVDRRDPQHDFVRWSCQYTASNGHIIETYINLSAPKSGNLHSFYWSNFSHQPHIEWRVYKEV